jgi:hypothetical protein
VQRVVNLGVHQSNLKPMPKQMALDEKTCWNPTWTTIDNVVSKVLGAFSHAHLFEVKTHCSDHYGLSQSIFSWVQVCYNIV